MSELTIRDVIDDIAEVLNGADGDYLARVHNEICSGKVVYKGDSRFYRLPELSDEFRLWAAEVGWSVFEAEDLVGMWDWAGPDDQVCTCSFGSEEEAWADMVEGNGLEGLFKASKVINSGVAEWLYETGRLIGVENYDAWSMRFRKMSNCALGSNT